MYFRKWIAAILSACSMCGVISVSASPLFQDVTSATPYANSIQYCVTQGYTKGYSSNYYGAHQPITLHQFLAMELAALKPEVYIQLDPSNNWYESIEKAALETRLISQSEIFKEKSCSYEFICQSLMNNLKLPIYSNVVWDEEPVTENHWESIQPSAKHYGLLDGLDTIKDWKATPTRSEVSQIFFNAFSKEKEIQLPEIASLIPVTFKNVSATDRNWTYETLKLAPKKHLERVKDEHWEYIVTREPVEQYFKNADQYGDIIGLTDYHHKKIYVETPLIINGSKTILHELGHFVSYYYHTKLPNDIYEAEKEAITKFLGHHAGSDRDETFADSYGYILLNQKNPERLQEFKYIAPKTYQFMVDFLIKNLNS